MHGKKTGKKIHSERCDDEKPRLDVGTSAFQLIPIFAPKNFTVTQEVNQSLLQTEYINNLTWEQNELNKDKTVAGYKIYLKVENQLTLLSNVSSTTFSYSHRKVQKETETTYVITTVNGEGIESPPTYFTLRF